MIGRLSRMQADLARALQKPVEKRSWVMVIDVDRCIGCHACVVSCMAENAAPPGVSYRVVPEVEDGEFPDVKRVFMPTNCQQCDNPPCVEGLPEDYYTKRPDGILVFHYDKMRGEELFEQVQARCPFTAVYYDDGRFYTENTPRLEPYETRESFEYGQRWKREPGKEEPPIGSIRKCHFCLHRLEAGMLPACVTTCVGGAMYFGDLNDPKSLVSELLKSRESLRLNEEETQPRVWYITGTVYSRETCMECHA